MNPTTDDATPRSASYRETYRRHRLLCWTPVVLGAVAAAFILFTSTTSYRSTASLWIDTASNTTSSIGANGSPSINEPPASSEQGILAELLTTDSFASAVVHNSPLGKRPGAGSITGAQASRMIGRVTSTAAGEQILNLSYTASSRGVAQSVLQSVINQLQSYNNSLANDHAQAAIAFDREQVKLDETAVQTATANVKAYLGHHPDANKGNPTYVNLSDTENNAITALGSATTTLNQATASTTGSGWIIRVLDAATPAVSRAPSKKKTLAVILGGAFGGLLVSLLAIIALAPARREEREEEQDQELASLLGAVASDDDAPSVDTARDVTARHRPADAPTGRPSASAARRPAKAATDARTNAMPKDDWFADVSADDRAPGAAPADPFVDAPESDSFSWEAALANVPSGEPAVASPARPRSARRTQPERPKPTERSKASERTKTERPKTERTKTR